MKPVDINSSLYFDFNPIQDVHFWGCSWMRGGEKWHPP